MQASVMQLLQLASRPHHTLYDMQSDLPRPSTKTAMSLQRHMSLCTMIYMSMGLQYLTHPTEHKHVTDQPCTLAYKS